MFGFSFYKAEEVLWATAATTLVTLALTVFALQTKVSMMEHASVLRECVGVGPLVPCNRPSPSPQPSCLWAGAVHGLDLHGTPTGDWQERAI